MQPTLNTPRLILRPFELRDAQQVRVLAGEKIIADMTANIPHPYEEGMAEQWIELHPGWYENRQAICYAIVEASTNTLVGSISIGNIKQASGSLGYWIGTPFWGKGFCTEAAHAILMFAFEQFDLSMVNAEHLINNSASGKVMIKNGFQYQCQTQKDGHVLSYYELPHAVFACRQKALL